MTRYEINYISMQKKKEPIFFNAMERSDKRWGRGNARRHKETFEVE
jgi:hypothetical protein